MMPVGRGKGRRLSEPYASHPSSQSARAEMGKPGLCRGAVAAGLVLFSSVLVLLPCPMHAQTLEKASGMVLRVDQTHRMMLVSCDRDSGGHAGMDMSFSVRDRRQLGGIHEGMPIRFTVAQRGAMLYATHIHVMVGANLESEPMQAAGLSTLESALNPSLAARVLTQGQQVPDFELTDQAGKQVRLSSLNGKVVLLTFGYSRCPNPDYCVRLSDNLAHVRDRFAARMPRDLVLITIAIDPEHDQGSTLSQYAAVWKADSASWHFLTGPVAEIKSVAAMFGMNFWREEGLLTHTLHTVVIDRSGVLAANLEGNQYTAQQLGDLVETVMNHPR